MRDRAQRLTAADVDFDLRIRKIVGTERETDAAALSGAQMDPLKAAEIADLLVGWIRDVELNNLVAIPR